MQLSNDIIEKISEMPEAEQAQFLAELEEYGESLHREELQNDFIKFARAMWPGFIDGRHHKVMAKKFEDIASGKLKRLIICMPPRHSKSQLGSYLFPAWLLGKYPDKKIIQCSNTAELAVGFGRNVRNLIQSPQYSKVFPGVNLRQDSKAAGRWAVNRIGEYFAIGVGGTLTGKGADCAYFDDTVSTNRGIIPIADVCVGDYVMGYDHVQNKPCWTRVLAVSTQYKSELVNIDGVLLTPEHRIYSADGYVAAKESHSVAMLDLQENVLQAPLRASKKDSGEQNRKDAGLLFTRLLVNGKTQACMRVRQQKISDGRYLQSVLPKKFSRHLDVRHVWKSIFEATKRVRKIFIQRFSDSFLLLQEMLHRGKRAQDVDSDKVEFIKWKLSDLWKFCSWKKKKVLLNGVLLKENIKNSGIFRKMEFVEVCCQKKRWWNLCMLRKREAENGNSPYRPRCNKQRHGECNNFVRSMPQSLSSSVRGASARSFKNLLQEKGHWVVDIQTESKNFFIAPPGCGTQIQFNDGCILAHNCLIIDDPHSEQEAKLAATNPEVFDQVYEWYTSGPRQRLQPGAAIVVIQTRWSKRDLVGRILKASAEREGNDDWEIIEFPAILPSGNPLWPEFWSLEELEALKSELPVSKWNAQYQQQPTSEEGALVKREWWKIWEGERPPPCEYILASWDTAFETKTRSDYSACTTWGVFYKDENPDDPNIILLDAVKGRWEFPELKQKVLDHMREWQPDCTIIEKRSSGAPLIYELRRAGIPVEEFVPTRGNDKIVRLNAVTDLFASGKVWAPDRRWAEEVIDEVASFPNSEHDDLTDTVSQALLRFRRGGFVRTSMDEPDEPVLRKKTSYY